MACSADDPAHLRLRRPSSWLRGPLASYREWEGFSYLYVGAVAGELEFQRYRPRSALHKALADCDLIQVVSGSPAPANAVCGLGMPVALQCATRARVERRRRDADPRSPGGWWRKAMTEITDRMDDRALRTVDAIQVENPWMFDYAQQLNVGRNVDLRYAPPGVDVRAFHPLSERDLVSDPYILCVGRLDDLRKNIKLLLEAYAAMPGEIQNRVRLVLAGSSGPDQTFWTRAESLGVDRQVSYIERPTREALITLYQHAAAFALPSDEEGLGVVLLEAMGCGIPVVSTRSGGPDGIISDGTDGFLVPLDDAPALSDRLARLCSDEELNRSMGLAARGTVERRYAEEVAGEAFVDMWDRLVAGTRR